MTELWLPVEGFEGFYEVSDLGRVRSLSRPRRGRGGKPVNHQGKILTPVAFGRELNYRKVTLSKDGVSAPASVHSLVAAAFIGPRPHGFEVCHFDGDGGNNAPSNLRYDTREGNSRDMIRHGRSGKGSASGTSKLSDADVKQILALRGSGIFQRIVAAQFNVSRPTISLIWSGKNWPHISSLEAI